MAKRFERLYIEYSYIYNVAKLIGKASENHTDNYRQL